MAIAQNLRHLFDRFRQHNHQRQLPVRRKTVGLEHAHGIDRIHNPFARHDDAQIRDNLLAPLQNASVRFRHDESAHLFLHRWRLLP